MFTIRLRRAALLFFGLMVLVGAALPVYTDEVVCRLLDSRYWIDGQTISTIHSHCQASLPASPFWVFPFALLKSTLYFGDLTLLRIRLMGLLLGCLGVVLGLSLLRYRRIGKSSLLFLLFLVLFATGTTPHLIIVNREEPALIIFLFLAVGISLSRSSWWTLPTLTFLFAGLVSSHPKSVLSLPIFLGLGFFPKGRQRSKLEFSAYAVSLFALGWSAFHFWTESHLCPLNPYTEKFFRSLVLTVRDFQQDGARALHQAFINLFTFKTYLFEPALQRVYQSWLPPSLPKHFAIVDAVGLLNRICLSTAFGATLYAFLIYFFRGRNSHWSRKLFGVGILLNLVMQSVFQSAKPFYESGWIFALVFCLGISAFPVWKCWSRRLHDSLLEQSFYYATLLSLLALLTTSSLQFFDGRNQVAIVPKQLYSEGVLSDTRGRTWIQTLSHACRIGEREGLSHLVVDNSTYPYFSRRTLVPYHILGLTQGLAASQIDLPTFLKDHQSAGLLVKCVYLPNPLRSTAIRSGPYCCHPAFTAETKIR